VAEIEVGAPLAGEAGQLWERLRRFSALPDWLRAAADRDVVGDALREHVPGLVKCDVERFLHEGDTWSAWYELTVEGAGKVMLTGTLLPPDERGAAVDVPAAPFGTPSWHCRLPDLGLDLHVEPPGKSLPVVARLVDPAQARTLLEDGIRADSIPDYRVAACAPRIVRDKPGRCTLLADVEYPADASDRGWPTLVVVKAHEGDEGANAWTGMRALWDSSLADGRVVTLAQPLAYLADLRVLVQGPVPQEADFKDLMRASLRSGTAEALAELDAYTTRTAQGLAALHHSGLVYGQTVAIADELAELRAVLADLAGPFGDLAAAGGAVLDRVEQLAAEHPAGPAVPSHRSFRPGQVLLDHGKVGFIDFDGLCMAEPALDVALFRASAKDLGVDKRTARADPEARLARVVQLERVCDRFLDDYAAAAPVSRVRVALWETLDLLTNYLRCWSKVKPERVGPTMLLLERQLAAAGL
jgi:hypothetical protein